MISNLKNVSFTHSKIDIFGFFMVYDMDSNYFFYYSVITNYYFVLIKKVPIMKEDKRFSSINKSTN